MARCGPHTRLHCTINIDSFYCCMHYNRFNYTYYYVSQHCYAYYTDFLRALNIRHESDLIVDLSEHDRFTIPFHFTGLPVTGRFVARDTDMQEMRRNLLPSNTSDGRKIYILYGLGGIGKTQLAVAYLREHQEMYSAILWLNGNSKYTLMQSLAAFGKHAGLSPVSEAAAAATQDGGDVEAEARAVLRWLALPRNRRWLMIVDNVDRDYNGDDKDPLAYDIKSFLPPADHGYIEINQTAGCRAGS